MLIAARNAIADPPSPPDPATVWIECGPTPRRIDAIEVRLRRLVDSSEPAVVFSSLVRLCVPAFSDACWVDIVEGGRVGYRVGYPQPIVDAAPSTTHAGRSIVTAFESHLPGWAPYTGVMTSLWYTRRSTAADEERASAIVDRAMRMIRGERLADPDRSRLACAGPRTELRSQLRSR